MGRQFTTGQYVSIEAQLFGPSLEPLAKTVRPKLLFQPAAGGVRREIEMAAKSSQGEWAGWFQGRFIAPKPGDYKLELPIPSSSDVLPGIGQHAPRPRRPGRFGRRHRRSEIPSQGHGL
jgi:hypothetical protein